MDPFTWYMESIWKCTMTVYGMYTSYEPYMECTCHVIHTIYGMYLSRDIYQIWNILITWHAPYVVDVTWHYNLYFTRIKSFYCLTLTLSTCLQFLDYFLIFKLKWPTFTSCHPRTQSYVPILWILEHRRNDLGEFLGPKTLAPHSITFTSSLHRQGRVQEVLHCEKLNAQRCPKYWWVEGIENKWKCVMEWIGHGTRT